MLIREIEAIGKGKYKVIREDGLYLTLYTRELKGLGFEVDSQVGEEAWAIGAKSQMTRGKKRVFHLLAKKDYTEYEIRSKLQKENYHETFIEEILTYFKDLAYIDDYNDVSKYYNWYKTNYSRRIIEQKLSMKGIDREVMKTVINEAATEEDAYETARRLAWKKYGGKDIHREDYPKMTQFLMRKGFDYSLCKKVALEILEADTESDF